MNSSKPKISTTHCPKHDTPFTYRLLGDVCLGLCEDCGYGRDVPMGFCVGGITKDMRPKRPATSEYKQVLAESNTWMQKVGVTVAAAEWWLRKKTGRPKRR